MQNVDKNDVDISILFNWGTVVVMKDAFDNDIETLYVRLVGDADTNRARTYALRKSAELRDQLKTPGSDERVAFIPDWKTMKTQNLIELVVQFRLRDYVQRVTKDILLPLPIEPKSDASLEKHEEYQKEVDSYPSVREGKIKESLESIIKSEKDYLRSLPKGEIVLEVENAIIAELCEQRMFESFQAMVLTLATHTDPEYTTKFFKSVEEFEELISDFKDQLFKAYNAININTENLKKLPGVTQ